MAKKYKISDFQGYQRIVSSENSDLKNISLAVIKNPAGERFEGNTLSEENVFVLTRGSIRFYLEGRPLGELSRAGVFEEPPSAVYLPPHSNYSIEFIKEGEVLVSGCVATGKCKARLIEKKDLKVKRIGEEGFLRTITEIVPEDFSAEKLIVGETIVDSGNWASYPPHKHDTDNPPEETALEELYFFKIYPERGFGIIRIFNNPEDNIFLIRNDEVVTIPRGYHPVCVAPKHQMYYLWIMAGNTREVISSIHPDFKFNNKNSIKGVKNGISDKSILS